MKPTLFLKKQTNSITIENEIKDPLRIRINNIYDLLKRYYGNLTLLYSVAAGDKRVDMNYKIPSRKKIRMRKDEKQLQWTVDNLKNQITHLENELNELLDLMY